MLSLRLSGWLPDRRPGADRVAASRMKPIDTQMIWVVAILALVGLVMVYSTTVALPDSPRFSRYAHTHFLMRHLVALAVGSVAALAAFSVSMRQWQRLAPWLFLSVLVMLVLVLIPGIGKVVYGARRWLSLFVLNLQPSELMKLFVALYAADYAVRKQDVMKQFKRGFLPMGGAVLLVGGLLLLEPDLGAFMVIAAIAMGVLFLGGVNGRQFTGLIALGCAAFAAIIIFSPWRRARIFAYLDPFDPTTTLGKGYQLSHSLIAFGRGELVGVGLGASVEKLHYLPEAHTDFLLAVIGEEFGLVGVLLVITLFYMLVKRAVEIGRQAIALERNFAGLAAQGLALWLGVQGFINMGVNLGLLPTKGLTLPLMSYGGSGVVVNLVAVAVLLRVDFENRQLMRGAAI
jgi:cell division protein FtsW